MPSATPETMLWTEEESKYLRAVLSWESLRSDEGQRRKKSIRARALQRPPVPKPTVGEFRLLVIGAQGVGKTSILTRFCEGRLPRDDEPADPYYEQGCRHAVEIEGQSYMIDALEMPSRHLRRHDLIQQAVHITEAALLVYDVTAPDSLRHAQALHEVIKETAGAREYGVMLVGNKADCADRRCIPYSVGVKVAAHFQTRCGYMEVSARTGDHVDDLFSQAGTDIIKLKWMNQQRKEHAERMLKLAAQDLMAAQPKPRRGIWKRISRPFLRRPTAQT